MAKALQVSNYALLVLYPVAWFAPLLKAGFILPIFGLTEISVVSGLQSLWDVAETRATGMLFSRWRRFPTLCGAWSSSGVNWRNSRSGWPDQ